MALSAAWLVLEKQGQDVVAFHEVVHPNVATLPPSLGLKITARSVTV